MSLLKSPKFMRSPSRHDLFKKSLFLTALGSANGVSEFARIDENFVRPTEDGLVSSPSQISLQKSKSRQIPAGYKAV